MNAKPMNDELRRDLDDVRLEMQKLYSERRFYVRRLCRVDEALAALSQEEGDLQINISINVFSAYQFAEEA